MVELPPAALLPRAEETLDICFPAGVFLLLQMDRRCRSERTKCELRQTIVHRLTLLSAEMQSEKWRVRLLLAVNLCSR